MKQRFSYKERILIIDDEEANIQLLERMLRREGYTKIKSTADSREASIIFRQFQPDIVLLDLIMPHCDGFEVMEQLKGLVPEENYLPILILTGDTSLETRRRALTQGATDFIIKPFDMMETLLRIKNMLKTRSLQLQLQQQNLTLEQHVKNRTRELEEARLEIIKRLAVAVEYRDDDTGEHTIRVGFNTAQVAQKMGLSEDETHILRQAAPLHDVGKVRIPDAILLKRSSLTVEEFEVMKTHTIFGAEILSRSRFQALQVAERVAHYHHERWDGSGYPEGLAAEGIPIEARIVNVVDVFDALTHERPYKRAWSTEEASEELRRAAGKHSDPCVVKAFLGALKEGNIVINEQVPEGCMDEYEKRR